MMKSRQQIWAEKNPEKVRITKRNWRNKNKDKVQGEKIRYKEKHPERVTQQQRNWRENNLKHCNQYSKNYKLIEENRLKSIVRELTWQKYGSAISCSLCNSKIKVEHHHLKPYNVDNFIDLCRLCHEKVHKMEEQDD